MKNILIAAVALTAISAPAMAQTTTVNGSVGPACSVMTVQNLNLGAISGATGLLQVAAIEAQTATLGPLTCNGVNATMSVTADRMKRTQGSELGSEALAAGFRAIVLFDATVTLAGFTSLPTAGITVAGNLVPSAVTPIGLTNTTGGTIALSRVRTAGGGNTALTNVLVAGDYAGTVAITIAAGA